MEKLPSPKIHLYICINDRVIISGREASSCGPTITKDMVREVKLWIIQNGWANHVYCTCTHCQGGCNPEGGVISIYPSGRRFKGIVSVDEIKKIILEEMEKI